MLKSLQRFFNTASAETQEVEMVETKTEQAATLAVPNDTAEYSALVAQMASQTETLLSVQTQLAEAVSQLAAVEAAKAALVATAAEARTASRKTSLEAIIGTAKSADVLASLEGVDEATFATVLGAMAASFEAEAKSPMFQEKGVAAEAEPVAVDPVQKLAAALAEQFKAPK